MTVKAIEWDKVVAHIEQACDVVNQLSEETWPSAICGQLNADPEAFTVANLKGFIEFSSKSIQDLRGLHSERLRDDPVLGKFLEISISALPEVTDEFVEAQFVKYDVDGRGYWKFAEFKAWYMDHQAGIVERQLAAVKAAKALDPPEKS